MVMAEIGKYRHVQALSRGLQLLAELNRAGPTKPSDIARSTGIDRTTVYRLLNPLEYEGLVVRTSDENYALTLRVRQLSDGFTEADWAAQVAGPELGNLVAKVRWPSDFATFEAGAMIVRESTHRYSPYSIHRSAVGRTWPVLTSAMGRAVIAAVAESERDLMLELIIKTKQPDALEARRTRSVLAMIERTREQGYAASEGELEARISAIALPVRARSEVVGAVSMVFFRSAMTPSEAARRHLGHLQETVDAIAQQLISESEAVAEAPARPAPVRARSGAAGAPAGRRRVS